VRHLRYILPAAILVIGVICLTMQSGCKNKCGSTTCQNGGTCTDNVCICPQGYSGNSCQTGWSDIYLGTYTCTRSNCRPAVTTTPSWQSVITKDASNSGYTIDISNFDGNNVTIVAIVDSMVNGVSRITISPAAGSYGVNATGTLDSATHTINLAFTSSAAGGVGGYSCNMALVKLQ
jgi:EGF-like domain